MTSSPTTTPSAGDVVKITATVKDASGNAPAAGTQVEFNASSGIFTGSGSGSPTTVTATTTAGGTATADLRVTKSGSVSVTAKALSATSSAQTLTVSPGPVAALSVTSDSSSVLANGTDSALIRAAYRDAYGNTVTEPDPTATDGQTSLTFRTSLGTFLGTTGNATQADTVNGVATATLVGGTYGGTAIVSVSDGVISGQVTVTVVRDPTINLQTSTSKIVGGTQTATLTATVLDSGGKAVKDVAVTFSTTLGAFGTDGVTTVATTDVAGRATATLSGDPSAPGTAFVAAGATVSGKATASQPVSVQILGSLNRIELTSSTTSARANGRDTVTLEAAAYDAAGNRLTVPMNGVGDGQIDVTFRTTLGTFGAGGPQQVTVRTVSGTARATLVAPSVEGVADIGAASGTFVASSVTVTFVTAPPTIVESLVFQSSSSSLVADGFSRTRLTVALTGTGGASLDGVAVQFETNAGALLTFQDARAPLTSPAVVYTGTDGKAYVYLESPKLIGQAKVIASCGGIQQQLTVLFSAGPTKTLVVTPSPSEIVADGVSTSTITVDSRDANDNPTDDGFYVTMEPVGMGSVDSRNVLTTSGSGTFAYTSGLQGGSVTLKLKNAANVTGQAVVTLLGRPVGAVALETDRTRITADDSSFAMLTLTVTDASGKPIQGATPVVTTDLGLLSGPAPATNALGRSTLQLNSSLALGKATVLATCDGKSASVTVDFVPGPPAKILVPQDVANLVADGEQTTVFRAVVLDADDHRVADGALVTLALALEPPVSGKTALGTLDSYSKTTADGTVTVTYRAPAGDADSTEAITFTSGDSGAATATVHLKGVNEEVTGLSLAVGQATLSADGLATTQVSANVTNSFGKPVADGTEVTFKVLGSGKGSLLPGDLATITSATAGGVATAVYKAGRAVGPVVVSAEIGKLSQSETLTLVAGPVATLTLTPSPSRIPPDNTTVSTLQVNARDSAGNRVNGTVTLSTALGTLSATSLGLVNGEGTVTLKAATNGTALVTGMMSGVQGTASVEVGIQSSGEPANILFAFTKETVAVRGVGGDEVSNIDVTVLDEGGNLIDEKKLASYSLNLKIVPPSPGGGEELVGQDPNTGLDVTTLGGRGGAAFRSGYRPGSVRIEATVTYKKNSTDTATTVKALAPKITILAGPPFSLYLTRRNYLTDNKDGSLSHDYLAFVTDQYGNAVVDNTGVYFGQIGNVKQTTAPAPEWQANVGRIPPEFRTQGTVTNGKSTFMSPLADFKGGATATENVVLGADDATMEPSRVDTLVIESGSKRGGYLVKSVSSSGSGHQDTLNLFTTFTLDGDERGTGLAFSVGNNLFAINPNGTRVGFAEVTSVVPTKDGVASAPNRYPGASINSRSLIYAETDSRDVGDCKRFSLSGTAPALISIIGAAEVDGSAKDSGGNIVYNEVGYTVFVTDSSQPSHYPVPGAVVGLSVGGGDILDLVPGTDVNAVSFGTFDSGTMSFTWRVPYVTKETTYTISAFWGGQTGEFEVTVKVPPL